MKKIDDLPQSMEQFKESFKMIILTEKLSDPNFNYYIHETQFNWKVKILKNIEIIIPFNVSPSTPPTVTFPSSCLSNLSIEEKSIFFNKLKELGMISIGNSRGQLTMLSYLIIKQESFYDFYLLWNEFAL